MKYKFAFKIINAILLVIVIFVVIRYLYLSFNRLDKFDYTINIPVFLLSIIAIWFWLFISATVFHLIMRKISTSIPFIENLSVWSNSYLGVYIPGKLGVVAFRIMQYQNRGISAIKVSYGFFIEMVLSVLSSIFVVLFGALFSTFSFINNALPWVIILFLILLILIHPKLINLYARLYFKYIKKTKNKYKSPYTYLFYIKILLLQLVKWCFTGIGIFILINSVTDLSIQYLPFITGLYAAAAILGLLAFFAPSGIGVVEGVMIFGLKSLISNAMAGLISVLVRIWKVIGELSFVFLIRVIVTLFFNKQKVHSIAESNSK